MRFWLSLVEDNVNTELDRWLKDTFVRFARLVDAPELRIFVSSRIAFLLIDNFIPTLLFFRLTVVKAGYIKS